MMGEPPTYSVAELEARASTFLAEHLGRPIPIPVDVEWLVETQDGVDLDHWPALRANHGVHGMVLRDVDTGQLFIQIDDNIADHQPNLYRMTVAEELGHLVLQRDCIDQIASPSDFHALHNHPKWARLERNAKRFAAAILMPAGEVVDRARVLYPQLVRAVGFGNPAAIKKQLTSMLAQEFEVSAQTMGYRLNEWPVKVSSRVDESLRYGLDYLAMGSAND